MASLPPPPLSLFCATLGLPACSDVHVVMAAGALAGWRCYSATGRMGFAHVSTAYERRAATMPRVRDPILSPARAGCTVARLRRLPLRLSSRQIVTRSQATAASAPWVIVSTVARSLTRGRAFRLTRTIHEHGVATSGRTATAAPQMASQATPGERPFAPQSLSRAGPKEAPRPPGQVAR